MKKTIIYLVFAVLFTACTKTFLDKKPDQSLVVPQTLSDFQALLNNTSVMNVDMPSLGEISSDDYYVTDAGYQSVTVPTYKNAYTWNKDIYAGSPDVTDWNYRYQQIFYCNVVLEGLNKLSAGQRITAQYRAAQGSALFYRGFALFQVAQLFCKPYNAATAAADIGVPVRTSSDINQKSVRATVAQTYARIIADLKASLDLLPQTVDIKTKPNLAAANGMLARVFLSIGEYADALAFADAALKQFAVLLDYKQLDTVAAYPFQRYNDEVIFHSTMYGNSFTNINRVLIDTLLYRSYAVGDLRRQLFFKAATDGSTYRGSYGGTSDFFNGIATDELLLIRAECYARQSNLAAAITDLNTLLQTRFAAGAFVPVPTASATTALDMILAERRRELIFRGLRWEDLRRLNMESGRAMTLTRRLDSAVYQLPPNDPRYVMPIPDLVIQLSGIPQNIR